MNKKKIILILTLTPALPYLLLLLFRPLPLNKSEEIFSGLTYERVRLSTPRPIMAHLATVDLSKPGIEIVITPGAPHVEEYARTTCEFLTEFQADFAINGGIFAPFYVHHPLSFFPHSGDAVTVHGQAIAKGKEFSEAQDGWPVLCFSNGNTASIASQQCPPDTFNALPGMSISVKHSEFQAGAIEGPAEESAPRSAVGIDATGTKLWIAVVDGRQWFYSEGMTAREVASLLTKKGATEVIEFDGGGSSTMAKRTESGCTLLNAPIHTLIPMRQRPIAVHLGFSLKS